MVVVVGGTSKARVFDDHLGTRDPYPYTRFGPITLPLDASRSCLRAPMTMFYRLVLVQRTRRSLLHMTISCIQTPSHA